MDVLGFCAGSSWTCFVEAVADVAPFDLWVVVSEDVSSAHGGAWVKFEELTLVPDRALGVEASSHNL